MSNPLLSLGLRRKDEEPPEEPEQAEDQPRTSKGGLELNKRGIPARKRKLNSLIYGLDDLVSIPVKSPKKRGPKTPSKIFDNASVDVETNDSSEIFDDKSEKSEKSLPPSPVKSPVKLKSPVKSASAVKKRLLTATAPVIKSKTPKSTKKVNKVVQEQPEPTTPNVKSENQNFDPELSSPEKKSAQKLGKNFKVNLLNRKIGIRKYCVTT